MKKGSMQEKDITFINMYIFNTRAPKFINHILLNRKGWVDNNTIIVEDFKITTYINGQNIQMFNIHLTSYPPSNAHLQCSCLSEAFRIIPSRYVFFPLWIPMALRIFSSFYYLYFSVLFPYPPSPQLSLSWEYVMNLNLYLALNDIQWNNKHLVS